jgi:hypothetical protein
MNAYYDPDDRQDLIDSIGRERGQAIALDCCYNDRRRSAQGLKPGGAVDASGASALDVTTLREAVEHSVLRWDPWTAPTKPAGETLYLHVDDAPSGPALVFTVCGDATYLSPTQVEECAHMIEDVLVQAALDLGAFLPARR